MDCPPLRPAPPAHRTIHRPWLLALLAAACSSGGSSGSVGDGGATFCLSGRSQPLSAPCCPLYGLDACGANLFCAALDGRTQPTCYPERSRLDGTACTEDRQCASGSCNGDLDLCRASPGAGCRVEVGCANNLQGQPYACDGARTPPACAPVGDGRGGAVCAGDADCQSAACSPLHHCRADVGQECQSSDDCVRGQCQDCDLTGFVTCANRAHARECLLCCQRCAATQSQQCFRTTCDLQHPEC